MKSDPSTPSEIFEQSQHATTVDGALACRYCQQTFPIAEGVKSVNRHVATGDCPEYAPGARMRSYSSLSPRDTETETGTETTTGAEATDTAGTLQAEVGRSEHATTSDGALACTHCGRRFPAATNINAVTGHLGSGRCPEYTPTSRPRSWDATTTSSADTGPTTAPVNADATAMSVDTGQETETETESDSENQTQAESGPETATPEGDHTFEGTKFETAADRPSAAATDNSGADHSLWKYTDDILCGLVIVFGYSFIAWTNAVGIQHQPWDQIGIFGFAAALTYVFGKYGLKEGVELVNSRR